jgi:recombinational DNA repair ATPase RecF
MLNTLTIKGFRCFHELRVEPLKRVNLFVGRNSSGKTSILDAADFDARWTQLRNRCAHGGTTRDTGIPQENFEASREPQ